MKRLDTGDPIDPAPVAISSNPSGLSERPYAEEMATPRYVTPIVGPNWIWERINAASSAGQAMSTAVELGCSSEYAWRRSLVLLLYGRLLGRARRRYWLRSLR